MRIGLIAMSGVRVQDPELLRVGLTLPGFVERSEVIASMPSLSLLTLAALTPPDVEVEYREILDVRGQPVLPDYDLVAIASYSGQIRDAYTVADAYVARGIPVVLGGPHVTALPGEAQAHGATSVLGEGELTWARVVSDARRGRLAPEYRPPAGAAFDLADAPVPRYDLLEPARYNRLTVQTARGCPHRCEFCAGSILTAPRYALKPAARVRAELEAIRAVWDQPFIELADDNSFAQPRQAREVLGALRDQGLRWFTEADIGIADDPGLLDAMREGGCRQVLVGLESPDGSGLAGLELKDDWKRRRQPRYREAIRTIQAHGITVNGCFILGLDGQGEDVFDAVYRFVEETGLYEVQVTVLTPFPGTPLYARLEREGRLLAARDWDRCTLFDVNFVPRGMSPERLRAGLRDLLTRLYEPSFVTWRRERFRRAWRDARRGDGGTPTEDPDDA